MSDDLPFERPPADLSGRADFFPAPDDIPSCIELGGPTRPWMRSLRGWMIREPAETRALLPPDADPFWSDPVWLFGSSHIRSAVLCFSDAQALALRILSRHLEATGCPPLVVWGPDDLRAFYSSDTLSMREFMDLLGPMALVRGICAIQACCNVAAQTGERWAAYRILEILNVRPLAGGGPVDGNGSEK